jgi:branched-chain amino acid transport system permease protein
LLNVISAWRASTTVVCAFSVRDITRLPAFRTAQLGVGRTFQTPRVFEDLSIWENLLIGADFVATAIARTGCCGDARCRRPLADAASDFLPHAQRRLLEVLRVIAMDCDVLLLDEPAAGSSQEERREFATLLRHLRDALGKTIILVEHDLHLVWRVADRITVLDAGAIIAEGAPDEIVSDPRVRALFTGRRDA